MKELEQIKLWNSLKEQINKIIDHKTRQTYYKAFLARFVNTYGFNPETPAYGQKNSTSVDLDDWEKEFVQDIQDGISFRIDTRESKRSKTEKEARARMLDFVRKGGQLKNIPDEIRCGAIDKLYWECKNKHHEEIMEFADSVIGKDPHIKTLGEALQEFMADVAKKDKK